MRQQTPVPDLDALDAVWDRLLPRMARLIRTTGDLADVVGLVLEASQLHPGRLPTPQGPAGVAAALRLLAIVRDLATGPGREEQFSSMCQRPL